MKKIKNITKRFLNQKEQAFTLMEILVATTLFVVVAVGGISVFLSSQRAYKRVSSNVVAIDNINMVMDFITREIRFGNSYGCVNTSIEGSFKRENNSLYNSFSYNNLLDNRYGTCNAIAFTPQGTTTRKVVFYLDTVDHSIRQALYLATGQFPNQTYVPDVGRSAPLDFILTSSDFKVGSFWANVEGVGSVADGDYIQPRVDISMSGIVDTEKNQYGQVVSTTTISVQSVITQKNLGN